jgi:CBS domain-containing protein
MRKRPVRSILRRRRLGPELVAARADETVCDAAKRMAENKCGSILIMDRERLLGIFTERDLLVRVVATGRNPAETRLADVMTTDIETISGDESIEEAIRRMDEGAFRHLPVVDCERVLGVLSVRDIPILELGSMAKELDERHRLAERMW